MRGLVANPIIAAIRSINFRGKARLLNRIGPSSGTRQARIFGSLFELDLHDYIQRQLYFGTFEPHETQLASNYLRPGMTFVDVGANVGYYTALAAMRVGGNGGRVVAFEPSLYAFERLQGMLDANRLEHVAAIHAGLSDMPGKLKLYLGVASNNHTPTMVPHENATFTDVNVTTLDAEIERLGIDKIDLIKIDVEGYEPRVLAGAQRLLRERRIRAILCEFNEHWLRRAGSDPQQLEQILREAGFAEPDPSGSSASFDTRFFYLP
jgi:FkbM family methyltransferase